jgi:hypothetical protein
MQLRSRAGRIGILQNQASLIVNPRTSVLTPEIVHFKLRTWLAPIFCGSPAEQASFPEDYDAWLTRRGEPYLRQMQRR